MCLVFLRGRIFWGVRVWCEKNGRKKTGSMAGYGELGAVLTLLGDRFISTAQVFLYIIIKFFQAQLEEIDHPLLLCFWQLIE